MLASVYKLALLVAYARLADAGGIDPAATVRLLPAERTSGSTGVAAMADQVEMSWRDTVRSMITVSDNAAADAVHAVVGAERINATLAELGLTRTRIAGGTAQAFAALLAETGAATLAEAMARLSDRDAPLTASPLEPLRASASTPREMTTLVTAIWTDRAASPGQCAYMREVLSQQIWPHRLAAGFPFDDVQVAGKTGSLAAIRNEVGAIRYPDGTAYAVAVFTRAARPDLVLPTVDAVIGSVARIAVAALRQAIPQPHPA